MFGNITYNLISNEITDFYNLCNLILLFLICLVLYSHYYEKSKFTYCEIHQSLTIRIMNKKYVIVFNIMN